jgi:hypothetical protein
MPTNCSESTDLSDSDKAKIELLKQEYKMAADRYENIYKAIWQIFQYVAALSAAILAFGSSTLPLGLVGLLAIIPLIFWYYVTFVPMNSYGDETAIRLYNIEQSLNKLTFSDEKRVIEGKTITFNKHGTLDRPDNKSVPIKVSLFTKFETRYDRENSSEEDTQNIVTSNRPHVRDRLKKFGWMILVLPVLFILFNVFVVCYPEWSNRIWFTGPKQNLVNTQTSNTSVLKDSLMRTEIQVLIQKIDSLKQIVEGSFPPTPPTNSSNIPLDTATQQ